MQVTFLHAHPKRWLNSSEYNAQIQAGIIDRGTSHVFADFCEGGIKKSQATIVSGAIAGPAKSFHEIDFWLKALADLRHLYVIDWYLPNLEAVERHFLQALYRDNKTNLYLCHDDLRELTTIPEGALDFVTINGVFPCYWLNTPEDNRAKEMIIKSITRVLSNGGIYSDLEQALFMQDIPHPGLLSFKCPYDKNLYYKS